MFESIFLGIIQNTSLLLAFALIFYVSKIPWGEKGVPFHGAHLGLFSGGIGIAIMASAWVFKPDILLDTRSILMAISGLFFGPLPTGIAMLITGAYAIYQGGQALPMNLALIILPGVIGFSWRLRLKHPLSALSLREVLIFGFFVHFCTLLSAFSLPWNLALETLSIISLPVMIFFPIATARLGLLLSDRLKQDQILIRIKLNEERQRLLAEEMRKREQQYRLLTENIKDVVWIFDVDDMHFDFVSPSVVRLRGFTSEEVLGQSITESMLEQDREHLLEIMRERVKAFRNKEIGIDQYFTDEMKQLCKDGSEVWTEIVTSFYLDPDNGRVKVRGVTHDISERKKVEESLRRKDQLYQSIIENAPDGVAIIDLVGHFIFVSPAGRRLFGYGIDEEINDLSPADSTHPDDLPAVLNTLSTVVQNPTSICTLQYRFRRKDGTWRWIESTFSNLFPEPDEHIIVINFRDITDRKQAEDALRESERKFRQIFETTTTGISLLNNRRQFLSGNPAILKLLGYSSEEYTSLTIDDISHPDDLSKDLAPFQELWDGNIAFYSVEKRNISKSGEVVWGQLTTTIVRDKDGDPQYAIGMFQNIGDRKRAEEKVKTDQAELQRLLLATEQSRRALLSMVEDQKIAEEKIRQLNAELELRVRDRTAQLQTANRELEAFSYSVSHDLRAPLRALDGFSSILLSDYNSSLDEKGQHYLNRIQEASRKMGQLINDLLSLSRVTRTEFVRQEVNLSAVVEDVVADLKIQEGERKIEVDIQPGLKTQGDIQLLKIAFSNLLSNSFKFTRLRKKARISIGMVPDAVKIDPQLNGEPVFFVRDNGAGFDMEYSKKLFTPFQRLHGVNEFPGTGIGLVIVQRIITRHGGRIWPEARVNKGATFYFTLGGGN
jgi:PAS domain S-box-containing protein